MSKPLFEITQEFLALDTILDGLEDDASEDVVSGVMQWMQDLTQQRADKIDSYAFVIAQEQARADVCAKQAAEFQQKATTAKNKVEFLKTRMMEHMDSLETKTLITDRFRFSIAANGGMEPVYIHDADLIPEALKVAVEPAPDKSAIRIALQNGETVPGAILMERGKHLRIK